MPSFESGTAQRKMYLPQPMEVVRAVLEGPRERFLHLRPVGGGMFRYRPGQFVQVSIPGVGEAPFSISSSPTQEGGGLDLCIRNVGSVTQALHDIPVGGRVGVRGPFGNGFDISGWAGQDLLFIAGGIGLVPLRSPIRFILGKDTAGRREEERAVLLYGAKKPSEILFREDLHRWEEAGMQVRLIVDQADEGWRGEAGVITRLIPMVDLDPCRTLAVVCGPPVMYRHVIAALQKKGLQDDRIVLMLERRMECGMGKCGHCLMGPHYVCKDGPVFTYSTIKGLREAV